MNQHTIITNLYIINRIKHNGSVQRFTKVDNLKKNDTNKQNNARKPMYLCGKLDA